jgi:peroxiredoxin
MGLYRLFLSFLIGSAFAWGARNAGTVDQAAARVEQFAAQSTPALRTEYRILAAQALKDRYPELADKFARAALKDLSASDAIDPRLLSELAPLVPEESIALLPHTGRGVDFDVAGALMRANLLRPAVAIYSAYFKKGRPRSDLAPLFKRLTAESPDDAKALFADFLAALPLDTASPNELFGVTNSAAAIAPIARETAVDVYDRVIKIASDPDYGKDAKPVLAAKYKIGSVEGSTANARDTLLVAAGVRLRALAPDRFEKYRSVLSRWDLAGPLTIGPAPRMPAGMSRPSAEQTILERMGKIRSLSDAERVQTVLDLAHAIQALPKGSKSGWASSLANLATEGDNGKEAMNAVASALGQGIQEDAPFARVYLELASLIRYEHTSAPISDSSLDAADAILALRERVHQDASFTLTSMDGKTFSLEALRGKVVLLNFWATWCPPCRKEMPDMEALYRRFQKKGLVVLAVSDEERETVVGFLAKQNYTFPILLDPGRKVNDAFGVEGIPKSFIFDAEGKLVAQAIDMRTERQFLDLLKEAGIE